MIKDRYNMLNFSIFIRKKVLQNTFGMNINKELISIFLFTHFKLIVKSF